MQGPDDIAVSRVTVQPYAVVIPKGAVGGRYSAEEAESLGKTLLQAARMATGEIPCPKPCDLAVWRPIGPLNLASSREASE